MKPSVWKILLVAMLYTSMANAQNQCAIVCDKQWESVSKQCPSGEGGRECRTISAEQHEACLNSCNRQPQEDALKKSVTKKTSLQGVR